MKMTHKFSVALCVFLAFLRLAGSTASAVDDAPLIAVEIDDGSTDPEARLGYLLREKIRASHTFKLVSPNSIASSIVWTVVPAGGKPAYYIENRVAVGGAATQDNLADSILAKTERLYRDAMATVTPTPKDPNK